jgi:hypothetical protein
MHGLVPCIHAERLALAFQGPYGRRHVDGRDKPGHDGW